MITLRSKNQFFKKEDDRNIKTLGLRKNKEFKDRFLRDVVIATANTRNMGLE